MLVDTSVWSLLLHRKKLVAHPAATLLKERLEAEGSIYITGIIYQEILQGVHSEIQCQKVKGYLKDFDFLDANEFVHEEAARIFLLCRSKGITAHTVDCLIAAVAIHYHSELLTSDNDFERIARFTDLKLVNF